MGEKLRVKLFEYVLMKEGKLVEIKKIGEKAEKPEGLLCTLQIPLPDKNVNIVNSNGNEVYPL